MACTETKDPISNQFDALLHNLLDWCNTANAGLTAIWVKREGLRQPGCPSIRQVYFVWRSRALNMVYVLSGTWCDQRIKSICSLFYLTSLPSYKSTSNSHTFSMESFETHGSWSERWCLRLNASFRDPRFENGTCSGWSASKTALQERENKHSSSGCTSNSGWQMIKLEQKLRIFPDLPTCA